MEKFVLKKMAQNTYYASLLQDVFGGANGETKCLMQMLYFCYELSVFENEFSKVFYDIAIDDLTHHNVLGEMIVRLGGEPALCSHSNIVFSGNDIERVKGIRQILDTAIEMKEKCILNYKILLTKIPEKEIKNILEIILCDERKHKELLENLLKKYQNNG